MTSRYVNGQSFTLAYDAENRLVAVSGAAAANFAYDADGKQVIGTVNGVTTYYVGNHYEVKSSVVTKYYFAGATRLAVRTGDTLSFLLADHIGSSSVTTDANGGYSAEALYKAFGETRYTLGNLNTDYHFTGQREEVSLGIYWFQSRFYDASLGRFTQPDSLLVPTGTQGTQAWDRYAFVNNNPVRYNDPTGHKIEDEEEEDRNSEEECTLCINYTLRPEDAEKLIADLDAILEILTAIDLAQLGIDAFTGVNSLLAIAGGGIQFMSPAFIAMATGVTAGSAAAASATIWGGIAIGSAVHVGLPAYLTTKDLQNLRDGLADADADTFGATINDQIGIGYHTITINSAKDNGYSKSFVSLQVYPALSYAPAFLLLWSQNNGFTSTNN